MKRWKYFYRRKSIFKKITRMKRVLIRCKTLAKNSTFIIKTTSAT